MRLTEADVEHLQEEVAHAATMELALSAERGGDWIAYLIHGGRHREVSLQVKPLDDNHTPTNELEVHLYDNELDDPDQLPMRFKVTFTAKIEVIE